MSTRAPSSVATAVAVLFVPGDRPERFPKALASGADLVILDLEDAVAPEAKSVALDAVLVELRQPGPPLLVRVNGGEAAEAEAELAALAGIDRLAAVVLPKAEDVARIEEAHARTGAEVVALVETAAGVSALPRLARARGLVRLAFGAIDFAVDVDAEGDPPLDYARSRLVVESRAAELSPPLDSPSPSIRDLDIVSAAARRARSFGFGGQLCIHPVQLDAVRDAFRPSDDELDWARRVIAASSGAVQLDGRMVDRPVIDRARRTLARAEQESRR